MAPLEITHLDGTAPHGHGVVWMNVPYAEASGQRLHLQFVWPPIPDWSSTARYPTVVVGQGVWEGCRALGGTPDPTTAAPGTIRGDLARDWGRKVIENVVHGSDSPESAAREIALWFPAL